MVDYRINLAKTFTSSAEERIRFYNRMLLYLLLCACMLVGSVYYAVVASMDYLAGKREQSRLISNTMAASGLARSDFDNPDSTMAALKASAEKLAALQKALAPRTKLQPIIENLFSDLPKNVELQSLSADSGKVSFGIIVPMTSGVSSDPVRKLTEAWESNKELSQKVASIRPMNGERRTSGSGSVFFVQFECRLKK